MITKYILFIFIFLSAISADAQSSLTIKSTPSNPSPLQKVQLSLSGGDLNLDSANITWSTNNRTIDGGIGKKSIEITAPESGVQGIVIANVQTNNGSNISTSISLTPGSIDLLWESIDSYVPPFYKGKALPATNSNIKITAIPTNGIPNSLNYTWTKDTTVLGSLSGPNKNTIIVKNSEFSNTENIGVVGSTNSFNGSASISIPMNPTSVVLYRKIDGFIDYANAYIESFSTNNPGVIFKVEPFFFSLNNKTINELVYSIKNGENDITNTRNPSEINLSAPSQKGQFLIPIKITHPDFLYQQTLRNILINFN